MPNRISLSLFALALTCTTPVFASGSGGGGGGFSMPSQSAPQFDAAAEYRSGIEALKAHRFDDAEASFSKVSKAVPKDPNSWMLLGLAKSGKNDLGGAEEALRQSLKIKADTVLAHRELGVVLAKQRKTDEANLELAGLKSRAESCGETCPDAAALKDGIAAITAALSVPTSHLEPDLKSFDNVAAGDGFYLTAVALINEHRFDEAYSALQASQKVFGPHPDILTYLGYTSRKLGHVDLAEEYYQQALAITPTHRGATEYYGELKVIEGDLPAAKALLASLEANCTYGCAEADELRRWIEEPAFSAR